MKPSFRLWRGGGGDEANVAVGVPYRPASEGPLRSAAHLDSPRVQRGRGSRDSPSGGRLRDRSEQARGTKLKGRERDCSCCRFRLE